jgi:myosin heavy subunit
MNEKASFNIGDHVFFKHATHSWVLGRVTEVKDAPHAAKVRKHVACRAEDAVRQCSGDTVEKLNIDADVAPCREDLLDERPDDLLSLTVLHDATLLRCLYMRYMDDVVYTNIGAIVVALNPFNFKIPRYMDAMMPEYLKEGPIIEKNMPHSWAQAHNTYHEMVTDRGNQCILISGESGAGKTEATKIVMKYLAHVSSRRGSESERAEGMAVGAKLNQCSPILESFGNARTVRNDNSSRFGKFMKVKFSSSGQLVGAHTTKYLLEKSRIVTASANERVYHAFYIVVRGSYASPLGLEADTAYKSINAGGCLHNSEYSTDEHFTEVVDAMRGIGIAEDEVRSVWATTGGILNALNVGFQPDGEGSVVDASTNAYLERATSLWQVDKDVFIKELKSTTLDIAGGKTTKLLRPAQAVDIRDATAKALYNALFSWLVEKSNEKCDVTLPSGKEGNWIGLLDIFGFEDFEKNSFEQLCINLANETLQNHYNNYIFTRDMEECKAEGIDVTAIVCPDNMPCLNMISGRGGVLALLDEECLLGQGTDLNFLAKVDASFRGKSAFYDKKLSSKDTFVIKHYAANVTYDVNGWLEKNRDTLKDDIRRLMRASGDKIIANLLDAPLPPDQAKKGRVTVGGFFKEQVALLMQVINSTNPHWIRCVKPHPAKKPLMFDGIQTMNQLESSGVLGTVKIRKAGYPIRVAFAKFTVRYSILAGVSSSQATGGGKERDLSDQILKAAGMKDKIYAQIGKTKVFMKSEAFPLIERKRADALQRFLVLIQRSGRGYQSRRQTQKAHAVHVQKTFVFNFLTEYRAYLRRSSEIRALRAKLRAEAELKFRGLRTALDEEATTAMNAVVAEYDAMMASINAQIAHHMVAEKKRIEAIKAQRDCLVRAEYVARQALLDDIDQELSGLRELYDTEIHVYRSLELGILEEAEKMSRVELLVAERQCRNDVWRDLVRMQLASRLEAQAAVAIAVMTAITRLEELARTELVARRVVMRNELKMRQSLRLECQKCFASTAAVVHQRRALERARDRELGALSAVLHETRQQQQRVYVESVTGASASARHAAALMPASFPDETAHWARLQTALGAAAAASPTSSLLAPRQQQQRASSAAAGRASATTPARQPSGAGQMGDSSAAFNPPTSTSPYNNLVGGAAYGGTLSHVAASPLSPRSNGAALLGGTGLKRHDDDGGIHAVDISVSAAGGGSALGHRAAATSAWSYSAATPSTAAVGVGLVGAADQGQATGSAPGTAAIGPFGLNSPTAGSGGGTGGSSLSAQLKLLSALRSGGTSGGGFGGAVLPHQSMSSNGVPARLRPSDVDGYFSKNAGGTAASYLDPTLGAPIAGTGGAYGDATLPADPFARAAPAPRDFYLSPPHQQRAAADPQSYYDPRAAASGATISSLLGSATATGGGARFGVVPPAALHPRRAASSSNNQHGLAMTPGFTPPPSMSAMSPLSARYAARIGAGVQPYLNATGYPASHASHFSPQLPVASPANGVHNPAMALMFSPEAERLMPADVGQIGLAGPVGSPAAARNPLWAPLTPGMAQAALSGLR